MCTCRWTISNIFNLFIADKREDAELKEQKKLKKTVGFQSGVSKVEEDEKKIRMY